jgi:hypothetical protein
MGISLWEIPREIHGDPLVGTRAVSVRDAGVMHIEENKKLSEET